MVDENITEVQLRNFIKERQMQKDVIETTLEVVAEELLAAERTFKHKIECRALLEALCEIENEIKELSTQQTLLLGWYDVATSHNVKSTLQQRCVRQRWNLQR